MTTNFKEGVEPFFFTFDNQRLYVNSNRGRDKKAIFEFDPKTAKEGRLIYENPEVDAYGLSYSRKRKVLTEVSYSDWKAQHKVIDAATAAIYADLEKKLPGYDIGLQNATKDETRFVVAAYNDRTQGARYVYDASKKTLTKLGDIQPGLAEADMAVMKPITYNARDGLTIHGYLTLPVGVDAEEPAGRRQSARRPVGARRLGLQSRGAVPRQPRLRGAADELPRLDRLRPEVLGSERSAVGPHDAGRHHRRREMLEKQGIADPKRVAIYGGSYGGYATLAGVTYTPELYACGGRLRRRVEPAVRS